jgi:hypothetical protein
LVAAVVNLARIAVTGRTCSAVILQFLVLAASRAANARYPGHSVLFSQQ